MDNIKMYTVLPKKKQKTSLKSNSDATSEFRHHHYKVQYEKRMFILRFVKDYI